MKLSDNFQASEFICRCQKCNYSTEEAVEKYINRNLIILLEQIRQMVNRPLIITSGIRCPEHNKAVGGADSSTHLRGEAADIQIGGSRDRYELVMAAMTKGCQRIGVYKEQSIVHVDVSTHGVPQDVLWIH
ncbi:MAG: DUF882 domain-containing protein [Burkholderiales bacterium]|nr:DUF882 domain-containing protein [Burkholderiales bacterium]